MHITNAYLASRLERLAALLEIAGENPFKVRAYRSAAATVATLAEQLAVVYEKTGAIPSIPGVGKAIKAKIISLIETGTFDALERARAQIPESVLELLHIRGLGPSRIRTLIEEKGVKSIEDLATLVDEGILASVKGFSKETESRVRRSLGEYLSQRGRMLRVSAEEPAAEIVSHFVSPPSLGRTIVAGSFRRGRETVGNLDVVTDGHPDAVLQRLRTWDSRSGEPIRSGNIVSVPHASGLKIRVACAPAGTFGAVLVHWTGSSRHILRLGEVVSRMGFELTSQGLISGGALVPAPDEESFYRTLGLPLIPPELREDLGELDAAAQGHLPDLIRLSDIRGDLHLHSTFTDGRNTMREMAEAALAMGYEYIAFTDHTKNVAVANGLDEERFNAYLEAIDKTRGEVPGIRILSGLEVDILADGTLDLPDQLLARLDLVIVAIHSQFDQPERKMTARVLKALENPHVKVLAHPSGRLIGQRSPLLLDLDKVLEAAREHGILLELNSNPARLDLNDQYCRKAAAMGIPIVISTDAHSVEQLANMGRGVIQARRGWLEPRHVANTLPWQSSIFHEWVKGRR